MVLKWFSSRLGGSLLFSLVLVGSQCSCRFSMVLSGLRRFSMFYQCFLFVLIGSQCSHRFSVVIAGSQLFS